MDTIQELRDEIVKRQALLADTFTRVNEMSARREQLVNDLQKLEDEIRQTARAALQNAATANIQSEAGSAATVINEDHKTNNKMVGSRQPNDEKLSFIESANKMVEIRRSGKLLIVDGIRKQLNNSPYKWFTVDEIVELLEEDKDVVFVGCNHKVSVSASLCALARKGEVDRREARSANNKATFEYRRHVASMNGAAKRPAHAGI